MINVVNSRCLDCESLSPSFNYEGQKKGLYCATHKKNGMIDVKNPRCLDCELLSPSFNYEGQKKGLYCATHKKDGKNKFNIKMKKK